MTERKTSNRRPRAKHDGGQKGLSIRSAASHSRARVPYSDAQKQELLCCVSVEQRVSIICSWMARGLYQPGSADDLAPVWSVTPEAVRKYAAEARRMLARELTSKSRDELLAELLSRISFLGEEARNRTEEVALQSGQVVEVRRPDHRTALRAAEATGELLGLKVQRHQHTITAGELTTDQIVEQLQQHGVRVELPALEASGEEVPAEPAESEESNA